MPLETQAKVLRALEERRVERLGSVESTKVNVRFIAATNKQLPEIVKTGQFRQDLYYRLNVFCRLFAAPERTPRGHSSACRPFSAGGCGNQAASSSTIQSLMAYDWPGNVRELQNAIQSSALMAGKVIDPVHLPSFITQTWHQPAPQPVFEATQGQDMDSQLQELEKRMILHALGRSQGIQKNAAGLLGIKERSLWHRLKKYDIDASSFKAK